MESWVQRWGPRTNAFCDLSSPSVWTTAPATKKWCQVIRSAAPVTQNHFSKPEDPRLQNASCRRKSAPGPPNSSDEHVSCTAPATENASLQILFQCPTPAIVFGNATPPSRFAPFWQGAQSLAPATQNDTWTSKSGANMSCFVHFDFEMCFAPQRRALFRHLNFQKWSEPGVFCTFWLRNVLRATTACTFSTSQFPKVVRTWGVFSFFTCKCASRHNGVHFFDISTSKSGPNVRFLLAFSLANVLRATTACNFSTSQFPKVVRTWGVFSFFTCTCASCHNGVHFFDISTSKSGPNVRFFTCKCASRHNSVHFFDISISKSGPNVRFFLAFSLANVLRATTACTFSTSQFPKVVRTWGVFSFFTCTCALCHNGVQFFISHLARWLCTRRFSKPTFRFPEPQIIGKTQCLATFLPFRAPDLLSSDSFSSLMSSLLLFFLLLFSSLWLFPSLLFICPYCRKFDF